MTFFYWLFLRIYLAGIYLASFSGNPKAKLWLKGRENYFELLRIAFQKLNKSRAEGQSLLWFHCASLGEFEQGRPLMEKYKKNSSAKILVTFFSPSGYE